MKIKLKNNTINSFQFEKKIQTQIIINFFLLSTDNIDIESKDKMNID